MVIYIYIIKRGLPSDASGTSEKAPYAGFKDVDIVLYTPVFGAILVPFWCAGDIMQTPVFCTPFVPTLSPFPICAMHCFYWAFRISETNRFLHPFCYRFAIISIPCYERQLTVTPSAAAPSSPDRFRCLEWGLIHGGIVTPAFTYLAGVLSVKGPSRFIYHTFSGRSEPYLN